MCCCWENPSKNGSSSIAIRAVELFWEHGSDRMMTMKVPIGHRRGSGANGIPKTASREACRGSVAYAAEPFLFVSRAFFRPLT
jgi:hypothetical protein